jgi:ubiquinone/menaquinone biosynthesis C-methylase UbiE
MAGKQNASRELNSPQRNFDSTSPRVIDYEDSDYQTRFWEQGGREYEDQVEAVALRRLLPESGKLLLELGAGAGRNTPRYRNFKRIVLLDYSFTQLKAAQKRLSPGSRYVYVAADVYQLPFVSGLFDFVTMIRTIHHLVEPDRALAQARRVLAENGGFILEYANKQNLKSILRYLSGRQSWSPFAIEPVEFVELNFNFHPKTVRTWLKENHFQIERQLTVSHFRIKALKRILPQQLLVKMDSVAQLTGDLWQFSPSVFVKSAAIGTTDPPHPGAFFKCPACGCLQLEGKPDYYLCPDCGQRWEIKEGIHDFRIKKSGG